MAESAERVCVEGGWPNLQTFHRKWNKPAFHFVLEDQTIIL